MHHPFTAPRDEDAPLSRVDPGAARARAYDVVMDGIELGGGSIRIHDPKLQQHMFSALGIDEPKPGNDSASSSRPSAMVCRRTVGLLSGWTEW